MKTSTSSGWPDIPFKEWSETSEALHLWTQIVGKYRLSHTPWVNHSWHATLYVTPRGLSTGPVPDNGRHVSIHLDFCDQICAVEAEGGHRQTFALEAMSVADFHQKLDVAVRKVGGTFDIHGAPNELETAIPFSEDNAPRPYDADAVVRFHQALVRIDHVFARFRTAFLGKVSPVHLFWGSFDLAVTRFSGQTAPHHPGGIPNLPDAVTREAYSHQVSSAGFWPGAGYGEPMFYSYAYPVPEDFASQPIEPEAAFWHKELGEFLLPYEAVRTADDPEEMLLRFLQSSYEAAATTGNWDRSSLECAIGQPRIPRAV